jgi:hypothetical protein
LSAGAATEGWETHGKGSIEDHAGRTHDPRTTSAPKRCGAAIDGAPSALEGLEIYGDASSEAIDASSDLKRRLPSNPRANSRVFARRVPPS